jgi:phosphoenolpyruvate carboxylase
MHAPHPVPASPAGHPASSACAPSSPASLDRAHLDAALTAACQTVGLSPALERSAALADLCRAGHLDEAAARIAALDLAALADLIRVGAARFHLLNKAEQRAIIAINRAREHVASPASPRPESIGAAFARLDSADHARAILSRLSIGPTLTAHPTEARRRSVLEKQTDVARCLARLSTPDLTPFERDQTHAKLRRIITMLLVTDEVRVRRLSVPDEVRSGLFFLSTTIWDTIPRLAREILAAARAAFGPAADDWVLADLPPLLTYHTWIGGDRDGNPGVTAERTRETLAMTRHAALERWDAELGRLRHVLSVSTRRVDLGPAIHAANDAGSRFNPPGTDLDQRQFEPLRVRLAQMRQRLATDQTYRSADLLEDLLLIATSLRAAGLAAIADEGVLADAIIRARVFGLHLASMDLRQHAAVHTAAVSDLLRLAGVTDDYASLDEAARCAVLSAELARPRPLARADAPIEPATAETLAALAVAADTIRREPAAIRRYVISMTGAVSDVLALLLLMQEAGLGGRTRDGTPPSPTLAVVPLFETIDDLARAPALMDALFRSPTYQAHLAAFPGPPEQEVMLGYSDSNKDGGFLMANIALRTAQSHIARVAQTHGIRLSFFHGRGGTVGRGGGRAGRAILAAPSPARSGRLRFTEQGEVITFRYALPDMARRHLEQIVHAALLAESAPDEPASAPLDDALTTLAAQSRAAYRDLIDRPDFWPWFVAASPVEHIGGLPIASRPVSRATGSRLSFTSLRAIPWVFSWIQMRFAVPGFYGLGTALAAAGPQQRDLLAHAARDNAFFSVLLDNAAQELARARLPIARRYARLAPGGDAIADLIDAEWQRARDAILDLTGRADLMDHSPVVGRSILDRNPHTDVLNLVQIELLARSGPRASDAQRDAARPVIAASINAIAAAMQSTG